VFGHGAITPLLGGLPVRSQNYLKVPRKLINVTNISISTENWISKSVTVYSAVAALPLYRDTAAWTHAALHCNTLKRSAFFFSCDSGIQTLFFIAGCVVLAVCRKILCWLGHWRCRCGASVHCNLNTLYSTLYGNAVIFFETKVSDVVFHCMARGPGWWQRDVVLASARLCVWRVWCLVWRVLCACEF